jgi:hypothetical protein
VVGDRVAVGSEVGSPSLAAIRSIRKSEAACSSASACWSTSSHGMSTLVARNSSIRR